MSAFNLSPIGNGFQFCNANGQPLNGGFLKTYSAGTSTPTPTYANNTGSISNGTSITLAADGRSPNELWIPTGTAIKIVLQDASLNVLGTWDNLTGINDTGSVSSITSEWIASGATPTYASAASFTTPGNTTGTFQINRRIQAQCTAGLVYGTITNSVFGAATTVTVSMDAGMALDNGLVTVNVGLLGGTRASVPGAFTYQIGSTSFVGPTIGVITGANASTGIVGEVISGSNLAPILTSGFSSNAASIALTAGDWDLYATVYYVPAASTSVTYLSCGLSVVSASLPGLPQEQRQTMAAVVPGTGLPAFTQICYPIQVNVSTNATYYAVQSANFTVSTMTGGGAMYARRRR